MHRDMIAMIRPHHMKQRRLLSTPAVHRHRAQRRPIDQRPEHGALQTEEHHHPQDAAEIQHCAPRRDFWRSQRLPSG